jgi:exonuclease SbcD
MKILHTSDWHLGRALYGRKRYEEFAAFLDWLTALIEKENIDILLAAGDIFDNGAPSNRAQELYYNFLKRISYSSCRHVIITAGNHDSPTFLDAPKDLLRILNVHVVGTPPADINDEVILLKDERDEPQAIICAVPYLRDRDIRFADAGESIEDKNKKLAEGIGKHYEAAAAAAEQRRGGLKTDRKIPIIAMGHLFTAGGKTVEGDGVRELYVGSLAHVNAEIFPPSIDYLALGHLHIAQRVGGKEHLRYCGSPLPMGFGEAKQRKKVVIVDFERNRPKIEEINIPQFQALERISGSLSEIREKIAQLKNENSRAWLEIEYTGIEVFENLRELLEEELKDSSMEMLRIRNNRLVERIMGKISEDETLDDLDERDVFQRCLDAFEVPADQRAELWTSYNEILKELLEKDQYAE